MYYFLALSPLLLVNLWHGFILASFRGTKRTDTISEHACESHTYLVAHRIMHSFASLTLIIFGVTFLFAKSYTIPAVVLIVGAIFDFIEVMTLNKDNSHKPLQVEPHQITAWAMAISYLSYGVLITTAAKLPILVVNSVWVLFIIILGISMIYKFKRFWIAQMTYFSLLATLIAIAHIRIIS